MEVTNKPITLRLNKIDAEKVQRIAKRVGSSPHLVVKALACKVLREIDE